MYVRSTQPGLSALAIYSIVCMYIRTCYTYCMYVRTYNTPQFHVSSHSLCSSNITHTPMTVASNWHTLYER